MSASEKVPKAKMKRTAGKVEKKGQQGPRSESESAAAEGLGEGIQGRPPRREGKGQGRP